jgi:hypothetical protein
MFVDVRSPDGRLLFRYDATRELIQVKERGQTLTVDLTQYQQGYATIAVGGVQAQAEPYSLERRRQGPIR